jgi:hypothetical protein
MIYLKSILIIVAVLWMLFNIGQIVFYMYLVRKYERLGDKERKRLLDEYNNVKN